jgi:hypothetical protein
MVKGFILGQMEIGMKENWRKTKEMVLEPWFGSTLASNFKEIGSIMNQQVLPVSFYNILDEEESLHPDLREAMASFQCTGEVTSISRNYGQFLYDCAVCRASYCFLCNFKCHFSDHKPTKKWYPANYCHCAEGSSICNVSLESPNKRQRKWYFTSKMWNKWMNCAKRRQVEFIFLKVGSNQNNLILEFFTFRTMTTPKHNTIAFQISRGGLISWTDRSVPHDELKQYIYDSGKVETKYDTQ